MLLLSSIFVILPVVWKKDKPSMVTTSILDTTHGKDAALPIIGGGVLQSCL